MISTFKWTSIKSLSHRPSRHHCEQTKTLAQLTIAVFAQNKLLMCLIRNMLTSLLGSFRARLLARLRQRQSACRNGDGAVYEPIPTGPWSYSSYSQAFRRPRSTRLLMGAALAPTGPPGASTLTKGQERRRSVCRGPCQFQGSARVLWRPCCKHGDVAMAVGAAHRGYPARGNKPRRQVHPSSRLFRSLPHAAIVDGRHATGFVKAFNRGMGL